MIDIAPATQNPLEAVQAMREVLPENWEPKDPQAPEASKLAVFYLLLWGKGPKGMYE